jgi:hypothetical protein
MPCAQSDHEAHYQASRYVAAAVRIAYWDVLQREPTAAEYREKSKTCAHSPNSVLELYRNLLQSVEFIGRYVLDMSPVLLTRVLINQLFGRSPVSADEISALAGKFIEAGWPVLVQHVLTGPEVQKRIFADIQDLAQHGPWEVSPDGRRWQLRMEPARPSATTVELPATTDAEQERDLNLQAQQAGKNAIARAKRRRKADATGH